MFEIKFKKKTYEYEYRGIKWFNKKSISFKIKWKWIS